MKAPRLSSLSLLPLAEEAHSSNKELPLNTVVKESPNLGIVNVPIDNWHLSIIQYETGLTVYDGTCEDGSISVNTAEWKSGMYVAVANDGENVITQKLSIGK